MPCIRRNDVRSMDSVRLSHLELTECSTDDGMKTAAFVTDALLDPVTSHSEELSESICLRLFKTKSYFDYLYAPGNEYLGARFQVAMGHLGSSESSTVVRGGFPWETLPRGARVVDMGSGTGSACGEIMKKNPLLKFTVQDLPGASGQAIAVSTSYMSVFKRIYSRSTRSTGTGMSLRQS